MSTESLILRPAENLVIPGNPPYCYERPSEPIVIREGDRTGGLAVPDEDREALLDMARWAIDPPFAHEGRSAFAARKEPLSVDGVTVGAYRLKGVGHYNYGTVRPPSGETYRREFPMGARGSVQQALTGHFLPILIHMGIRDDGTPVPVLDPPKPKGGLAPGRGENEFKIAVRLRQKGVPACTPVTWGQYTGFGWEGKGPMEFVALGQPSASPERIGDYFEPEADSQGEAKLNNLFEGVIAKCFEVGPNGTGEAALKIACEMARLIGQALRKAHEGGVVRFAGLTGNFSYMPDQRIVFMHDFDSSTLLESLDPRARGVSMVRDLESALFGLTHSLAHSHLFWIVRNERLFRKKNPAAAMLDGYFKGMRYNDEAVKIVSEVVRMIKARGQYPSPSDVLAWLENDCETFDYFLMCQLFNIFPQSNLAQENPLPYGPEELERHFELFTAEKQRLFENARRNY